MLGLHNSVVWMLFKYLCHMPVVRNSVMLLTDLFSHYYKLYKMCVVHINVWHVYNPQLNSNIRYFKWFLRWSLSTKVLEIILTTTFDSTAFYLFLLQNLCYQKKECTSLRCVNLRSTEAAMIVINDNDNLCWGHSCKNEWNHFIII